MKRINLFLLIATALIVIMSCENHVSYNDGLLLVGDYGYYWSASTDGDVVQCVWEHQGEGFRL